MEFINPSMAGTTCLPYIPHSTHTGKEMCSSSGMFITRNHACLKDASIMLVSCLQSATRLKPLVLLLTDLVPL